MHSEEVAIHIMMFQSSVYDRIHKFRDMTSVYVHSPCYAFDLYIIYVRMKYIIQV